MDGQLKIFYVGIQGQPGNKSREMFTLKERRKKRKQIVQRLKKLTSGIQWHSLVEIIFFIRCSHNNGAVGSSGRLVFVTVPFYRCHTRKVQLQSWVFEVKMNFSTWTSEVSRLIQWKFCRNLLAVHGNTKHMQFVKTLVRKPWAAQFRRFQGMGANVNHEFMNLSKFMSLNSFKEKKYVTIIFSKISVFRLMVSCSVVTLTLMIILEEDTCRKEWKKHNTRNLLSTTISSIRSTMTSPLTSWPSM